jgi:hypothetical protein
MATYPRKHPSYREVLEYARQLSRKDQQRLREELAKSTSVKLVLPSNDPNVIHSSRLLAKDIRKTVQDATKKQSLDDVMSQLRGRSWS